MAESTSTSLSPASAAEPAGAGTLVAKKRRKRRYSLLTRHDKLLLTLMVGIPLTLCIALIWGPTLASILFSFTDWSGIGAIGPRNFIGMKNYGTLYCGWSAAPGCKPTDYGYTFFDPALQHNLIWLAFFTFIASPLGMLLAVLLDREIRGTRIYQGIFFIPVVLSLAVVGRSEERRPIPPGSCQGRRRDRAADLLPGRPSGDGADQRRHHRHHRNRIASCLRPRLHHQSR